MSEGVIRTYQHHNSRAGAIIHVSTNTDFVARNEEFLDFVDDLLLHLVSETPTNVADLLSQYHFLHDESLVCELLAEQKIKFGEDIEIKKFTVWNLNSEEQNDN